MIGRVSWGGVGSTMASLMLFWAIARQFIPRPLQSFISISLTKIMVFFNPYVQIKFYESTAPKTNEAYAPIQAYLADFTTEQTMRLKGEMGPDTKHLTLTMDDDEEIHDYFHGAKLSWSSHKVSHATQSFSLYPPPVDGELMYCLSFHHTHRNLVINTYLPFVIEKGKDIAIRKRQRRLYSNSDSYDDRKLMWTHVPFEHPASFDTIAMDPQEKESIIQDLLTFAQRKEYYAKIGKAWKRGYLLYGPPGTGKSTMIAAMARLLDYDVYDLELTAVKNNSKLRKLLIETTSRSIIVIEDIDCSLELSGKRKGPSPRRTPIDLLSESRERKDENVTLSGLLNSMDGLWSSCSGERLIVLTTNQVEKLDPALIRTGRMDKHIEMSHCRFVGFKVLAKNYLGIESHTLFEKIEELMGEAEISPADVAECLMPKTTGDGDDAGKVEACLESLILELKKKSKANSKQKSDEAAPAGAESESESSDY